VWAPAAPLAIFARGMGRPERYRVRAPASGREAVISVDGTQADPDEVGYYDHVTGERMEVVARLIPDSESPSSLPRAPENLRVCPHCGELVGRDLSECPYCHRRMPAVREPVSGG
jgi:hypothetical protein